MQVTLLTDRPPAFATDAEVLSVCDGGELDYEPVPVVRLFEHHAARDPSAWAVRFRDERLRYGELDALSNQLAHCLRAYGVGSGVCVAVCLPPSVHVPLALLAIFKAGGVYMPIDPTHPPALIDTMLREAEPKLVLTLSGLAELTQCGAVQLFFDVPLVQAQLRAFPSAALDAVLTLDQPSHLVYTSGTTGRPKGVLLLQRNLAHYLQVARLRYGFLASDVFCSLARYTFSISMFELLSPLICGASLVLLSREEILAPERLARELSLVTVLHAGPSLLGNLFRYLRATPSAPQQFPCMRHASSGGDSVPPHLLQAMKQYFCNAELYVIYGSTEISCMGTTYPISRECTQTQTFVGEPFGGVQVCVVDERGHALPRGEKGEIWFAGKGVVPGYFKRPELDAERFVERDGMRFYKMGDIGRMHPDGNLEMLGRRDYQVQIRGMRVELLGIENTVCGLDLAAQCAVVVKQLDEQDVRLVAFVVGLRERDVGRFRRKLAQHLPDYMLPHHLVAIDALPVTHNGKLDRNKLAELPWQPRELVSVGTQPRNAVEAQLMSIFREVLGVQTLSIDDDFFDLGGHSLSAVLLMEHIENKLGMQLAPGLLFEQRTVRALAAHARDKFEPRPILLNRVAATPAEPALFMLAGVHIYRDLAQHLEGRCAVYGVYAPRELTQFDADSTQSVVELASDYIQIIRRTQPRGPYRLAGMSFGGIVAYEAAQQLRAAGEQVAFLGLLDSMLPEPGLRGRVLQALRILRLPSRQRWAWLRARARARLAGEQLKASTIITRHSDDGKLRDLEEARQGAYARAALRYMRDIRKFDGPVSLAVAELRRKSDPRSSPDCGFGRYVRKLRVRYFEATHLGLVEPPCVAEVVQFFEQSLL